MNNASKCFSRNKPYKKLICAITLFISLSLLTSCGFDNGEGDVQLATPVKQPNILFILADDHRWDLIGKYHPVIKTPNLDKLHKQSTRFVDFHANKDNKDKPFFAYIPTNAPHGPFKVADKYKNLYKDQDCSKDSKAFFGMITNFDENLGLLMQKMDEWKLSENTLLIFYSLKKLSKES